MNNEVKDRRQAGPATENGGKKNKNRSTSARKGNSRKNSGTAIRFGWTGENVSVSDMAFLTEQPSESKPAKKKKNKKTAQSTTMPASKPASVGKNEGKKKKKSPVQPALQEQAEQGNKKGKKSKKDKNKKPIRILFLGGVGEIGKNMTAIEYENDIIVIDAGDTFPDEEMPGVDLVVPDPSYLIERKDKIRAILLTHGHEDHIGGLAYLLKELNPQTPVYGTRLTLALADNKVRELRLSNVDFRTVKPGDSVKLGVFGVEFVNVNHSIAGAVALAIRTPYGIIYHSGDFKIDMTPVAGKPIDLNRIAQLGDEGVLLYMGESTNIERPGYTMSETVVGKTLDHLFAEHAKRRLIIATFASNVHRLQQIIDLAVKYKRKVALSGRSMQNVVEAATKIGELTIPEGVMVDVEKSKNYFDGEIVIVSTGSQGEPMSALTRMASGDFNKIVIGENDTIIISASPIPGNEKMVYRVINNLYKKGAEVVYESLEKIHVSGHACREEHKILHTLLRPKFFIPVHGEFRHLKLHGEMAKELGMPASNIFLAEIGNAVELTDTLLKQTDNFPCGSRIIDGTGTEDYETSEVMRTRKRMAGEGLIVVSMAVSDGVMIGEPNIKVVGILFGDERDYEKEIRDVVMTAVNQYDVESGGTQGLCRAVEKMLKGYLYKKTKQSPLILPVVTEL